MTATVIIPPPLIPGDTIGVMSPSSYVEEKDIAAGVDWLRAQGFNVVVHPQTFARHNQSAGTHVEKAAALHDLVENDAIKAIIFSGGGNRALHLLNHLDFSLIARRPKIYMGFSDSTAILNAISARTGLITYHGPVLKKLAANNQRDFNLRLLCGEERFIPLDGARSLRIGTAQGRLYGGNLALVRSLIGSVDCPDFSGGILLLEDINEELSRIDRDLCFLRRAGVMDRLSGIIFGQFLKMTDIGRPYGFSFEDIIAEHTAGLSIPILTNAPFGHGDDLVALPIGAPVRLEDNVLTLMETA